MFSPLPMKHLRIHLLTEDLPLASLILADSACFSPDPRDSDAEAISEVPGESYRQFYRRARSRLDKISQQLPVEPVTVDSHSFFVDQSLLSESNDWLGETWQHCSAIEEERHRLREALQKIDQLKETLADFHDLHIDLGLLQQRERFLDIQIGRVPIDNLNQLQDAVSLAGYLLYRFGHSQSTASVVVIGLDTNQTSQLKPLLDTAGFQPLDLPPEFHSEPEQVQADLQRRREQLATESQQLEQRCQNLQAERHQRLQQAAHTLRLAAPYVALGAAAHSRGSLSLIQGWVPNRQLEELQALLEKRLANPFIIEARDPLPQEQAHVPTLMVQNRLLRPFALLVRQYGTPRYGEVNPTGLFSISFMLMFGMMFGDVGHGAVFIAAALLAHRRLGEFTPFVVIAGLSSILFGFLYGSLFGYEHVLHAIWIAPLSDPLYMLSVALGWGIGFLLVMNLINIINRLKLNDRNGALFGTNGLTSLLLYISLIGLGYRYYQDGSISTAWSILAIASLFSLFGYQLIESQAPVGERILVAAIETFEAVTGYLSNTLSFLRVAAFSLNHVALALAVFTLAGMSDGAGHWLTVVLGNLFILILEGAIVTIQVLRLEYYEGFSRFFVGDGRAFKPLTL